MTSLVGIALAFLGGALASYLAVSGYRRLAERVGLFDLPNGRSVHAEPTPVGGGVVFVAVLVGACLLYRTFAGHPGWLHVLCYCAGGLAIAWVSRVDDRRHVAVGYRLLAHALAATVFVIGYSAWHTVALPLAGNVDLGLLGAPLTVLWIVGLTNAFNFADGLDGLAAGLSLVAGIGWLIAGLIGGLPILSTLGVFIAAGSLGFLGHNWHPARVFMGDVGSAFLGYTLAVIAVIGAAPDPRLALFGALLLWPCLFDAALTTLGRLLRGADVLTGHRDFLFHRLTRRGWSHRQVALLYATLATGGLVLAAAWQARVGGAGAAVVVVLPLGAAGLWQLARHDRRPGFVLLPGVIRARAAGLDGDDLASLEA